MIGISEVSAALSSLKAAKDIIQALSSIKTETAMIEVRIELQSLIIDAQQGLLTAQESQSAATKRIAELEREVRHLQDWSIERERYQLVNAWKGSVAYMPKPGMEAGQPAHWLCANCFDEGRKSFMQYKGSVSESLYGCATCKNEFRVANRLVPDYAQ